MLKYEKIIFRKPTCSGSSDSSDTPWAVQYRNIVLFTSLRTEVKIKFSPNVVTGANVGAKPISPFAAVTD